MSWDEVEDETSDVKRGSVDAFVDNTLLQDADRLAGKQFPQSPAVEDLRGGELPPWPFVFLIVFFGAALLSGPTDPQSVSGSDNPNLQRPRFFKGQDLSKEEWYAARKTSLR